MPESERLKSLKRLSSFLVDQRAPWDTHNKDIADYIHPRYGRFANKGDSLPNDGKKRMSKVKDGTAMRSLNLCSAGLYTGLCSPSRPFFRMGFMDKELMEYGPARMWADVVEKRIYWVLAKSRWYAAAHQVFRELPLFATGLTWASPHREQVLHWQTRTWGEYSLGINGWGQVDCCALNLQMPLNGIAARWGTKSFTQSMKNLLDKEPYSWKPITFMVKPREGYDAEKIDVLNMPYQFTAWLDEGEDILFDSGVPELNVLAPRWEVIGSSVYGFGPGHDILPDVKMLQEMQEKRLKGVALQIDPPVKVPTGYTRRLLTVPGGQNPVSGQNPESVGPLYQVNIDIRGLLDALNDTRQSIRQGLFNDVFLTLTEHPDMTATEALIREQEKLQVLGPVVDHFIGEYIEPSLELVYNEMLRIGMVPPPPPEIAGQQLKLEHISTLARIQEKAGFPGLAQFIGVVGQIAQAQPEALDKVDADQVVDELGQLLGVPPFVVRSDEDVAKLRQMRAAQQAQTMQGERLMGMAAAAKDLAGAQMEKPSLLTKAMEALPPGGGSA